MSEFSPGDRVTYKLLGHQYKSRSFGTVTKIIGEFALLVKWDSDNIFSNSKQEVSPHLERIGPMEELAQCHRLSSK